MPGVPTAGSSSLWLQNMGVSSLWGGERGYQEPKGMVSLCLSTQMWGQVAARTEFIPTLPEFIRTNDNNSSLQGVIEMEKWQTGLWPVQFHIPLLRHNLNNPFS